MSLGMPLDTTLENERRDPVRRKLDYELQTKPVEASERK
jgi:hypothetical protein